MILDKERLVRCDNIFMAVAEDCEDPDKYFEVCIILSEAATDENRVELRRNIAVESMGPRVTFARVRLEKVYWLNDLPYVETISAPTDSGFDELLNKLMATRRLPKSFEANWLNTLCGRVGQLFRRRE